MLTASSPNSQLIDAPMGKLEVDALWQDDDANNPKVDRVALICHPNPLQEGTMMNKVVTTMYRFARDNGMHAVRFNFRGIGQSTGTYGNVTGEIEDAMTVLQWILGTSNARQLWLGGFSFGGFVAASLAQQIIQQGAFFDIDDMQLTDLALIAPSVEKNDTTQLILPVDKTFMIYGDKDDVVPTDIMAKFGQDFGIRTEIIEGTGHFFHGKLSELKTLLGELSS